MIANFKNQFVSFFYFFFFLFRYFFSFFYESFFTSNYKYSNSSDFFKRIDNTSFFYFNFFFKKKFLFKNYYYFFDFFYLNFFYFNFFYLNKFVWEFRSSQLNVNKVFLSSKKSFIFKDSFLYTFKAFWSVFRYWILALILFALSFYYLTYIRALPFNKVLFEWFLITMFVYWLISGFVFFFKKYQYSKYTSVIQRFWKRSYILFWMIESGVFLVFFYLTMNASEEPVYMYDQMKLYKSHLFSWRLFIQKLIPVVSLIIFAFLLQLKLKWSVFSRSSLVVFLLTLLVVYVVWLEFYQFMHIISFYGNLNWNFNYEEYIWNLEHEFRRTRLANNYINLCLIAKFWHLIFIFVFWVFFVLRVNESKRIRYPLFSANSQNFIILYIMSWLYMYPWLKFIMRSFLDVSYYWFFLNFRKIGFRLFFNDFFNFYIYFFSSLFSSVFSSLVSFNALDFFYWHESSSETNFLQFKKHALRDYIVSSFKC